MWKSYDGMEFEAIDEDEARKKLGSAFGLELGTTMFDHLKTARFGKVRTVYEKVRGKKRPPFLFVWLYACLPEGAVAREGPIMSEVKQMAIYELVSPSDPYTFEAPNIKVAGVVALLLSGGFGANRVSDDIEESSPVLFGWGEWLETNGIDKKWVEEHKAELGQAFDSFLIGDLSDRQDAVDMLAELPPEKREAWRAKRQDRRRSSVNRIGERAYELAKRYKIAGKEVGHERGEA